MKNGSNCRMVVLGAGNELMKDDGVGVHLVRALAQENLPPAVEIIEGGTLLDCLTDGAPISKLVVVDAVSGGGEPGAIYRLTLEQVEAQTEDVSSVHQLGLIDSLKLSEIAGTKPKETVIVGIEPKEITWGLELSPEVRERLPEVIRLVLNEIHCGLVPDGKKAS